ncbi:hypothetical protein KK060_19765 [Fulvivirgaceae bacterium PWU20]|uniref:Uncharacterized protein n=2 Tax=Chryseosolibacter indicus TaxID=2782351 RepID=A0ABS5VVS1_9BACT|nr:hypothetical protein [Chryseosolibacter indicus]
MRAVYVQYVYVKTACFTHTYRTHSAGIALASYISKLITLLLVSDKEEAVNRLCAMVVKNGSDRK